MEGYGQGLQQHLLASHSLFRYQASDCYPEEERCIVLESPEYLYDKDQFFAPCGIWERGQVLESQRAVHPAWTLPSRLHAKPLAILFASSLSVPISLPVSAGGEENHL